MNNNSIQIERYLQNEMSAEERTAFENQLAADKSLQEELHIQQQIVKAANHCWCKKRSLQKPSGKKIITKQLLQWGIVIIVAAAAVIFFTLKK